MNKKQREGIEATVDMLTDLGRKYGKYRNLTINEFPEDLTRTEVLHDMAVLFLAVRDLYSGVYKIEIK